MIIIIIIIIYAVRRYTTYVQYIYYVCVYVCVCAREERASPRIDRRPSSRI